MSLSKTSEMNLTGIVGVVPGVTVAVKGKRIWQKINPLAFQLILRCQRHWAWLGLVSE